MYARWHCRNGEDWWRLRKEFQKDLSKPQNVINYIPDTDSTIIEFMRLSEKNEFEDTLPLLSRLFLERKYIYKN